MHGRVVNVGSSPMMVVGEGDALAKGCIVELLWLAGEDKNKGFEKYGREEDSSSCRREAGGFSEIFQEGMRDF